MSSIQQAETQTRKLIVRTCYDKYSHTMRRKPVESFFGAEDSHMFYKAQDIQMQSLGITILVNGDRVEGPWNNVGPVVTERLSDDFRKCTE